MPCEPQTPRPRVQKTDHFLGRVLSLPSSKKANAECKKTDQILVRFLDQKLVRFFDPAMQVSMPREYKKLPVYASICGPETSSFFRSPAWASLDLSWLRIRTQIGLRICPGRPAVTLFSQFVSWIPQRAPFSFRSSFFVIPKPRFVASAHPIFLLSCRKSHLTKSVSQNET